MDDNTQNVLEDNRITDEQAQAIAKDLDDFVKGTDTEMIQNFPSNNGVETRESEAEEGESKVINTTVNPITGENIILSTDKVRDEEESVNDKIEKISIDDLTKSATEEEITTAMQEDGMLKEISKDVEWSTEEIKQILDVTNRRIRREKFNVYRALPISVQNMINKYITQELGVAGIASNQANAIRNSIAESIIDQFQTDINLNRAKHDFAHELASIYQSGITDISGSAIDYSTERNKQYREAAEKIEDPAKRNRMIAILDRIDQARSLDELKEFAKKCKIKAIELEKPKRVIGFFMDKYKTSANNIYDIELCKYTLGRNLPERTDVEIMCFFIVFCKYVMNWDINIPLNHAFIYYVLYYCALLDGDKSDIFKNNVREVIDNIKVRNPGIDYGELSEEEVQEKIKAYEDLMASAKKYEEEAAKEKESEEEDEEDTESEEDESLEYENDEDDDLIESVENSEEDLSIGNSFSYNGFSLSIAGNGSVSEPCYIALPDDLQNNSAIAVMTIEEYSKLPKESADETLHNRFKEIVDAYLAEK
ncbi:MAG: hypothetical protein IKR19_08525 [Acholeplasmatales bacterium]|nr:hypothetical protein [Acholeplasmatales bacterium]